jgi:hypothetical protein
MKRFKRLRSFITGTFGIYAHVHAIAQHFFPLIVAFFPA